MPSFSHTIPRLAKTLAQRWENYIKCGDFEVFVEFALSLNGLSEQLKRLHLAGLVRACQELENLALSLFGDESTHPVAPEHSTAIAQQLGVILTELHRQDAPAIPARRICDTTENPQEHWQRPRRILIISPHGDPRSTSLAEQLHFFGFTAEIQHESAPSGSGEPPLAIVFIPDEASAEPHADNTVEQIGKLRNCFPTSYIYCLAVPMNLESIVQRQRAGADACIPASNTAGDVLSRILDLAETGEQDVHRVLVVEDSATAIAHIRRSLSQHGIDSLAINDPRKLLETAADYRPDAILMDMYMPFCTGVEVTSALRQIPEFQALPVIYLSSETDIVQQVEALRLGGDQFLTKPVNPIILASVVKTKIERYREMLYAGRHDSLTGLLNHATSKSQLKTMLHSVSSTGMLVVAMLDIDRFKLINDNHGHPVGDQVIRSLAWLLRGRLRSSDLIGRYGGEEFIIALPNLELESAISLLNQIREDFGALPHSHAHGVIQATFSCGVAALPDYQTASTLIQAADDALLEAKRNGRNRVIQAIKAD
jgi:diguanylate cyclase (GGDEF)-like protein